MKISALTCGLIVSGLLRAQSDALPAPHFHHLHLNSVNPDAAIEFYVRQFPSTAKSSLAGLPALKAGNIYLLFNKVATPPATQPQTAIWHFGWHVVDVHKSFEMYQQRKDVHLLPLYTTDEGGFVYVSSDTWPGAAGSLGRTKAEIAEAKAKGIQPTHGAGFAYLEGPDGAIIEYQGNMPAERFNHVHMYQKEPFCAELWYHQHLNARVNRSPGRPVYTEANCKMARPERSWPALEREGMFRMPAGVAFDDVTVQWHIQQDDNPLVSSLGHVSDHVGLSVLDLDAWAAKLRHEGVKFLREPYKLGEMRAVMIEGPSREALELVEIK
jgi:catechol 2,3-dioxygenase-like lactoylglutathione lyase family enzyme